MGGKKDDIYVISHVEMISANSKKKLSEQRIFFLLKNFTKNFFTFRKFEPYVL